MHTSKIITISRGMTDEERCLRIKKTFAGTIYETAGDLKVFTKIWNEYQDRLQEKWKAEAYADYEEYDDYEDYYE